MRSSNAHPDLISFSLLFYGFQGTLCGCADTAYSLLVDFFLSLVTHVLNELLWMAICTLSGFLLVAAGSIHTSVRSFQFFCLSKDVSFNGRPHVAPYLSAKLLYVEEENRQPSERDCKRIVLSMAHESVQHVR